MENNEMNSQIGIYYHGDKIKTKVPLSFIKENIHKILNRKNINKYINENDLERLKKFLPPHNHTKEFINNILDTTNKFYTPMEIFSNMMDHKYFNEQYQNNLEKLNKVEALEDYISIMEDKFNYLKYNFDKCLSQLYNKENNNKQIDSSDDEEISNNIREYMGTYNMNNNLVFETYSELASSGYTTINEDEKDYMNENQENQISAAQSEVFNEKVKENESACEGALSDERFKNLKMNKNQLTILTRSNEELSEFHRQESERYKNPHLPWIYNNPDGSKSIVSPVLKKIPTASSSKPRDHVMLKSDRPSWVTILSLARDAASRMPDGVGTRADICDLLKDSQFINERLSDAQINNIVSGALDRLHYEKDPCVKYDLQKKLWIYLHKNREIEYAPWNEHINKEAQSNTIDVSSVSKLIGDNPQKDSNNPTSTSKKKKGDKMLNKKRKHS